MAESRAGMPREKETVLGLYVTAKEAYEMGCPWTYKLTSRPNAASPGSIVPGVKELR
jgi:hypothetical protein